MKWVVLTWKDLEDITVVGPEGRESLLFDSDGEARAWAYNEGLNNVVIVRVL